MKLFREDINKHTESYKCPTKEYWKNGQVPGSNDTIDMGKVRTMILRDGLIPACGTNNEWINSPDSSGCCIADTVECPENHSIGLKYLVTGSGGGGKTYNICHKDPVQTMFNSLFDDPNKITKFLKLIFATIVTLLITAIIGTCYEFWLRYGDSKECIYYKSKCSNIGKDNEISLINYLFPDSICYYPYQKCTFNQSGGKTMKGGTKEKMGIVSNYAEYKTNGAKCITLHFDDAHDGRKPIPYNFADYVNDNIDSEILRMPVKAFSFFFLFSVLFIRKVLNYIFSKLSQKYQNNVKHNPAINNFVFLILTGLFFPFIGYFLGMNEFYVGPMFFLGLLFGFVSLLMSFSFFISFLLILFPNRFFFQSFAKCNLDPQYYRIFSYKLLYSLMEQYTIKDKVLALIKNICLVPLIFIVMILSINIAVFSNILAIIYMNLSLLGNIFYLPLSNPMEFFDILKSHGDLLTIMFCIGVVGASSQSLDSTTTGIMGGLLALIVLYKIINGFKKNI